MPLLTRGSDTEPVSRHKEEKGGKNYQPSDSIRNVLSTNLQIFVKIRLPGKVTKTTMTFIKF